MNGEEVEAFITKLLFLERILLYFFVSIEVFYIYTIYFVTPSYY